MHLLFFSDRPFYFNNEDQKTVNQFQLSKPLKTPQINLDNLKIQTTVLFRPSFYIRDSFQYLCNQ